jgi:anti-sigma regulatory factor (Ser/Thr protein kinase)
LDVGRDAAGSGGGERGTQFRLSMDLPEGAAYVEVLRKTVRCLLLSVGVPRGDVEDVEVILGELATNAVLHAGSLSGGTGGYRVELELHIDRLLLLVSDHGPGFTATELMPAGAPRPDPNGNPELGPRFGGWGLPLVRRLSDQMEILPALPHGTVVRLEKRWSATLLIDRLAANTSGFP